MCCLATIHILTSILLNYFKLLFLNFAPGITVITACETIFLQLFYNKHLWPLTMADLERWVKYIRTLLIFLPLFLHWKFPVSSLENAQAVKVEEALAVN